MGQPKSSKSTVIRPKFSAPNDLSQLPAQAQNPKKASKFNIETNCNLYISSTPMLLSCHDLILPTRCNCFDDF